MTPTELHDLGTRLRRSVRGDLFEYIEGTLPLLLKPAGQAVVQRAVMAQLGCPKCAERRQTKAEAQKRWRMNRSGMPKE